MTIEQLLKVVLIAAPVPVFILLFTLFRRKGPLKALYRSADFVTVILFFSVPLSAAVLWKSSFFAPLGTLAVIAAIVFLVLEWKNTKEIEVAKYFRKIWRFYFLFLAAVYTVFWLAASAFFVYKLF